MTTTISGREFPCIRALLYSHGLWKTNDPGRSGIDEEWERFSLKELHSTNKVSLYTTDLMDDKYIERFVPSGLTKALQLP
jgi:hypothetical protein